MPGALQHIEKTMIDKLFSAAVPLSGLEKTGQVLCVLSVSFLVAGLLFLMYGAHIWLSIHYSEDITAIITGIISLTFSAAIASVLFAVIYYHKIRARVVRKKIADKIKSSLSILEDELGDPVRENPKTALIIASFLGFLVEDRFFEYQKNT